MPYRRKYRKKPYKKNYRRRRGTQRSLLRQLSYTKSPLPKVFKTKLRYSTSVQINAFTSHTTGVHVFSCNGIYDPDVTGTGHQPRGFDQLMPMFDHYRVLASRIMVRFFNSDATNPQVGGIAIRDSTTTESTLYNYTEQGTVKTVPIGTQDTSIKTLRMGVAPHKWLGLSYKEDSLKGTSSTQPSEQCYYHVFAASPDSSVDPAAVNLNIEIDYLVQFIEPKDLTAS